LEDKTLKECQEECNDDKNCVGVEYFRPSGASDAGTHFKKGDCNLSSSQNIENCNINYHQMYQWNKKDEIDCNNFDAQDFKNEFVAPKKKPEKVVKEETKTKEPVNEGIICPKRYVDCKKYGGYDPLDPCKQTCLRKTTDKEQPLICIQRFIDCSQRGGYDPKDKCKQTCLDKKVVDSNG